MAFVQRLINVTFQLSPNVTGVVPSFAGGGNTAKLTGLRTSCHISKAGTAAPGAKLSLRVYGMTLSVMNQLAMLGMYYASSVGGEGEQVNLNSVLVEAGDAVGGMATVFIGTITQAYADMTNAPDVAFVVEATALGFDRARMAKPPGFQQSADIPTMFSGIAKLLNRQFLNQGVSGTAHNVYLNGSPVQMLEDAKRQARCEADIDETSNTLVIWPLGQARQSTTGNIPIIAPPPIGQMIGYPIYDRMGIIVRNVYNPSVLFYGLIQVQGSQLTAANGTWRVWSLEHDLESLVPHGQWMSTIFANKIGQPSRPPQ